MAAGPGHQEMRLRGKAVHQRADVEPTLNCLQEVVTARGFPEKKSCHGAQCCESHLDAAKKGHLHCLESMVTVGNFLMLDDPGRASAGELRKQEVWHAAVAACMAGQSAFLEFLFRTGWPQVIDAVVPPGLRDTVDEWNAAEYLHTLAADVAHHLNIFERMSLLDWMVPGQTAPMLAEWELYRAAVSAPTLGCLAALLRSGCRSPWVCTAAVHANNLQALEMASKAGIVCDPLNFLVATCTGNQWLLSEVYDLLVAALGSPEQWGLKGKSIVYLSKMCAAHRGYAACSKKVLCHRALALGPLYQAIIAYFNAGAAAEESCAEAAASQGHLDYLKALVEWGHWSLTQQSPAPRKAILGGHLPCLTYLVKRFGVAQLEPGLLGVAIGAGKSSCYNFLMEQRYAGGPADLSYAISCGPCADAVRYWLPFAAGDALLLALMRTAVKMDAPECMEALYQGGYHSRAPQVPRYRHPAILAVENKSLACLEKAVEGSGPPNVADWNMEDVAAGGLAMLQYVHVQLKGKLATSPSDFSTTLGAAGAGDPRALQYALDRGAPWQDVRVFDAAVKADSLACLRCLHQIARVGGYPKIIAGAVNPRIPPPARSLAVLLFTLETVLNSDGHPWAAGVVSATINKLAFAAMQQEILDWEMLLCLAKKLQPQDIPWSLRRLATVRRERAAALARVFFAAGKSDNPSFYSMGEIPSEIQEIIAYKAHLVMRPKQGNGHV